MLVIRLNKLRKTTSPSQTVLLIKITENGEEPGILLTRRYATSVEMYQYSFVAWVQDESEKSSCMRRVQSMEVDKGNNITGPMNQL